MQEEVPGCVVELAASASLLIYDLLYERATPSVHLNVIKFVKRKVLGCQNVPGLHFKHNNQR